MPDALGHTEAETARILGIADRTLRRWRAAGAIGYVLTPGGRIRYTSENIRAVRQAMMVPATLGMSAHVLTRPK